LKLHNGSCSQCFVKLQVSSKRRYGWDYDNHLVLLAIASSTYNALNDCCANLVLDGTLLVSSSCDEELVLDVDKVLTVPNGLNIRVLNRVLLLSVGNLKRSFQYQLTSVEML
jgi:hypothetical protein